MMTDGVSGMGEEEEDGGDGILIGHLHHMETYKAPYSINILP